MRVLEVDVDDGTYTVRFPPMDPMELAKIVAAVIRAAADNGVEFQQVLNCCRRGSN